MKIIRIIVAAVAATVSAPLLACASCGCTLTSDWLSQGFVAQPGTTVALRYDYVPQTTLRSGTSRVGKVGLPADREIERYTDNHYLTASVDRQFNNDWGVNVQVPFVYRPHATISEGETERSYSRTRGLGDIRITGRWQGLSTKNSITGLQFGVQLPTGGIHQKFRSGTEAGEEVDRGLQPGTGATQAIIGAYSFGRLSGSFDYILQAQAQLPFSSRSDYHPGKAAIVSAGVHYTGLRGLTPQVEMSFRTAQKDSGITSDRTNSGGDTLAISPGLTVRLWGAASGFVYMQVPLYQRVPGYQLTPRYSVSAGIQYRL